MSLGHGEWRRAPDGTLERVDPETGQVIERQKVRPDSRTAHARAATGRPRGRPKKDATETHHWVLDGDGQKHWVPKGTDPGTLPKTLWPYSETTTELVCRYLFEGKTLTKIGLMEGIPPVATLYWWRVKYPEFKRRTDEAIEQRAHLLGERTLDKVDEVDEDNVQAVKLQTEIMKWGASVGDPDKFGARLKHAGQVDQSVTFIIETGVPVAFAEPEKKPAIEVKSEVAPPALEGSHES